MNLTAFTTFLKQYYERVLAVGVMLFLAIFSARLVFQVNHLQLDISEEDKVRPKMAAPKLVDGHDLKESLALLKNPPVWNKMDHRLFIAPYMKVLNPVTGFPERVTGKEDGVTKEGLPFSWLRKYGLSTTNPVADTDPDGDGFTVREEFEANTNPIDSNSKPDFTTKLRVIQVFLKPAPFTFNGTEEGASGTRFDLLRQDGFKSYFVKMGESIPAKDLPGWKVVDYKEKYAQKIDPTIKKDGKPLVTIVDVSELTLQKEAQILVLVKGTPGFTNELLAKLYFNFMSDKRYFDVGKGDVFSLQNIQYKVIELKKLDDNKSQVIVKRVDTAAEFTLSAQ